MALVEDTITHTHDGDLLEAYYAYDNAWSANKPAVLISHAWGGRDHFVINKARKLAELGYVGFAVDMYGQGILGKNAEENGRLMRPLMENRQKLQQRMLAAVEVAKELPCVNNDEIAAIGFCFGGLCALDLARTGAAIKGVVSFHGLLKPPGNTQGNKIQAKVLALHGNDDPMVPPEHVLAFQEEMTKAGVDWQFISYGNTMHAFTNPAANDPGFGTVYQADADRRSWLAMQNFFAEIFD